MAGPEPTDQETSPASERARTPLLRYWRAAAGGGLATAVVIVFAVLALRAHRAHEPAAPPWLPAGCAWVRQPPEDCPATDAADYAAWVKKNSPVSIRHTASGIELVWVPGATFEMGSDDGNHDEQPVHRVKISSLWVGRTEVTVAQWRAVMGPGIGADNDQGDDHPIVDVSWRDCQGFLKRTGLMLPSEAQWEYAARGPEGRVYPWGNWWMPDRCRSAERRRRHDRTSTVGTFPEGASWGGALDMAGNVWEWCRDWYDKDFYASLKPSVRDPECTRSLSDGRVLRGGSWFDHAESCRSACRNWSVPDLQDFDVGFRVARGR
jgi:formylglycine-generating enzyme required for sulfatase activity